MGVFITKIASPLLVKYGHSSTDLMAGRARWIVACFGRGFDGHDCRRVRLSLRRLIPATLRRREVRCRIAIAPSRKPSEGRGVWLERRVSDDEPRGTKIMLCSQRVILIGKRCLRSAPGLEIRSDAMPCK